MVFSNPLRGMIFEFKTHINYLEAVMKASLKFFFIFVVFCFTLGCQSEQEKKEAFFNSADKYYAQKEYKKAEIELKNAIKIDPQYIQANYLLAETMVKLGNLKEAFGQYSKVIQIDPDNHGAQIKVAEFLFLGKKSILPWKKS